MSKTVLRPLGGLHGSAESQPQLIELPRQQSIQNEEFHERFELIQSDLDQHAASLEKFSTELKSHRADIESSVLYLAKILTDKAFLNRVGELEGRIMQVQASNSELRQKIDRYTNLPGLKQLRALRRWWFNL